MEKYIIQGIPFQIKVLKHIKRISVWGWGELVLVQHKGLEFEAYFCDIVITNLGRFEYSCHDQNAENESEKYFTQGRVIEVVADLHVFGGEKDIETMPDNSPGTIEYRDSSPGSNSTGEWSITGTTISEINENTVVLDCGIPVQCISEDRIEDVPIGTALSMNGELQLVPTKDGMLRGQSKNTE